MSEAGHSRLRRTALVISGVTPVATVHFAWSGGGQTLLPAKKPVDARRKAGHEERERS